MEGTMEIVGHTDITSRHSMEWRTTTEYVSWFDDLSRCNSCLLLFENELEFE